MTIMENDDPTDLVTTHHAVEAKVKWFDPMKGYGFVETSFEGPDAFLHLSVLQKSGFNDLAGDSKIVCDLGPGSKGLQVISIHSAEQAEVQRPVVPSVPQYLPPSDARGFAPRSEIFDWAFLKYPRKSEPPLVPDILKDLRVLAQDEPWTFGSDPDPDEYPKILENYLIYTFYRLKLEGKVEAVKIGQTPFAAFNTGLVDKRYKEIFACFGPNPNPARQSWMILGFGIAGEDYLGKQLVRAFRPLPRRARYYKKVEELIYDHEAGAPQIDAKHVLDNLDRLPAAYLEDYCPKGFSVDLQMHEGYTRLDETKKEYFRQLADAYQADDRAHRRLLNGIEDAAEIAVMRVSWNFKTAIPQYYPATDQSSLLLPLGLVSDEKPDVALVTQRQVSGAYLGFTFLPLHWSYMNARLICRPDSDWLAPGRITETAIGDEEGEEISSEAVS